LKSYLSSDIEAGEETIFQWRGILLFFPGDRRYKNWIVHFWAQKCLTGLRNLNRCYLHTYVPMYLRMYVCMYVPTYVPTYVRTYIHTCF
jgi:hypothetical protein